MSSTSGTGNGSDDSSSITNNTRYYSVHYYNPEALPLQTTPPRAMEEAWSLQINLGSSARAVPCFGNSGVISSFTATTAPTSVNISSPQPMMESQHYYHQLFCIDRPAVITSPNQGLANSTATSSCSAGKKKKRVLQSDLSNSEDARHKRMIKNRESAAKSRARKQAYKYKLEIEVERLKEENARIKREQQRQQESTIAAVSGKPEKHNHRRTSSAPY